jgi:hypothetical protein
MTTYDYKYIRHYIENENTVYICEKCDYKTCKKKYLNQHIKTKKHKSLNMTTKSTTNKTYDVKHLCECGNEYSNRQNLYRHRKKCILNNKNINIEINELKNQVLDLKNVILKLTSQNINTLINKSNISNSFNNKNEIKIFLNEHCANALSIQEFVKQLTITLEDINTTKDNTVYALTSIIERNLKPLSVTTRPIHYIEKDEWYMKDKEEWKEDNGDVFINETYDKYQKENIIKTSTTNLNNDNYIEMIQSHTKDLYDTERTNIKNNIKNNCKL